VAAPEIAVTPHLPDSFVPIGLSQNGTNTYEIGDVWLSK